CGVSLISANFSTGPTPGGSGGSPQGWIGPALVGCAGVWAMAGPTGAQRAASSAKAKASIKIRVRMASVPPVSIFCRSYIRSAVTPFYDCAGRTPKPVPALGFLRRPAVGLGSGATHQHGPLGVAEAVGLQERFDRLLVVDDCERARPIRTPEAALEPPGVEHALQRVPDVRERI